MTSHRESHTITDVKPEIIPGVQTGNGIPHDKYNIRGIAHVRAHRKDDISMQRRLEQIFTCIFEWGQGTCKNHDRTIPDPLYNFSCACFVCDRTIWSPTAKKMIVI